MKTVKKALCLVLCVLLLLSVCILPASAADYPDPSATDPAEWYLYGDNDRDGQVTLSDARTILRMAAYLEARPDSNSMTYGASDYDRDGQLTIRDARLVLRRAVGLDAPAAQTAHPYASKTSVTAAEAIAMLQNLNGILKPANTSDYTLFTYSVSQDCEVDMLTTRDLANIITDSMQSELDTEMKKEETANTFTRSYEITTLTYLNHLQLKGDDSVVFGNIGTEWVKSTSFAFHPENSTYTLRINFNNSTTGRNSSDSPLRQVISDINTAENIRELSAMEIDDADIEMQMTATINDVTYTIQDTVSDAYVEYTINAVTGIPVSAEYGYTSTITIPATMWRLDLGNVNLANYAMVMITEQDLTMNYVFHNN